MQAPPIYFLANFNRGLICLLCILKSLHATDEDSLKLVTEFSPERFAIIEATQKADNLYDHGSGYEVDFKEARQLFKFAADAGNKTAQFYYARMNQYGHGGPLDFEIAWTYYQAAAKNGERRAWNNLGYMLSHAQGREIDKEQGLAYYLEAAYRGMSMAMYNAAQAYHRANGVAQVDWALAAKWYRLCVQTYPRYASAWNNLGIILKRGGHGLEKNTLEALECFIRADRLGEKYGAYNLGQFYRDGIQECSPQTDLAESAFVRSGKRGHAAGWHQAGDLYFYPIDQLTESRAEKALYYYQMEEKLESESGFSNLAYLYYYGPDSIKNVEKAITYLERAAFDHNDAWAYRKLAKSYWEGYGVDINKDKAIQYYTKSANLGDGRSALKLGNALAIGDFVGIDFQKAKHWLEFALEKGRTAAANNLGYLYENGNGVDQDLEKAAEYYRIGITDKHNYSLLSLGYLHIKQLIKDPNPDYGISLIKQAADTGHEDSIIMMARIYRRGIGTNIDIELAKEWEAKIPQKSEKPAAETVSKKQISNESL